MRIYNKKTGRSLPSPLSMYQGGLYIGNFFPGAPVSNTSSDLFGNKNTGTPITYKINAENVGDKNLWAIILATKDYLPKKYRSLRQISEPYKNFKTSSYDGLYNKNSIKTEFYDNLNKLATYGDYKDWYVPSVDEMAFIAKNLPIGYYIPRRFEPLKSRFYQTSSVSKKLNYDAKNPMKNYHYFYTQSFSKSTYGTVVNAGEFDISSSFRLIRKVLLTTIN